jgi:hypothetical protein
LSILAPRTKPKPFERQRPNSGSSSTCRAEERIARGFETIIVTLTDGSVCAGILKGETAGDLTLMAATGQSEKLQESRVKTR